MNLLATACCWRPHSKNTEKSRSIFDDGVNAHTFLPPFLRRRDNISLRVPVRRNINMCVNAGTAFPEMSQLGLGWMLHRLMTLETRS